MEAKHTIQVTELEYIFLTCMFKKVLTVKNKKSCQKK
jgi:hypothetical protein